ncbi:hypothetical protein ACIQNU_11300 [Streptomyces sp. NPDC091292]|uniref:hypothetical protein n=1 Tax=Streptomyces sp. NPDC091292 TaxID=3365991 RepID=UPI003808AF58
MVAPAQIIEKLRGNVLLSVFSELFDDGASCDVSQLELKDPIFLAETMDMRIKDGTWCVIGNSEVSESIPELMYKVWVEPPGEYRIQDVRGNLGPPISPEQAGKMMLQKSFSPAAIEAALRGYHNLGPWHQAFDELTV